MAHFQLLYGRLSLAGLKPFHKTAVQTDRQTGRPRHDVYGTLLVAQWWGDLWEMNGKGCGRKRSWHNMKVLPAFAWVDGGRAR